MRENSKLAIFVPSRRCGVPKVRAVPGPTEARIAAFLDGESDGGELLHALYDHVLREPIPQSMRALLANRDCGTSEPPDDASADR